MGIGEEQEAGIWTQYEGLLAKPVESGIHRGIDLEASVTH
jgi:hypothetical protein